MNWVVLWLVLHILGAIIAFGPVFTFPLVGALVQKEPQHISFALKLQERIASRIVLPVALTMAVSGIGLILSVGIDLPKTPYLLVAIGLYVIAMLIALFVLLPTGAKLVRMVEHRDGSVAVAGAGPGAQVGGPPPAVLALIQRSKAFGATNTLLIVVIAVLMVVKPGGIVTGPLFG